MLFVFLQVFENYRIFSIFIRREPLKTIISRRMNKWEPLKTMKFEADEQVKSGVYFGK